ncbi:MAG: hypothetical protein J6R08_00250 [Opitutales bacterium]|nr:hypothetical protein [Opitutales bacterium]
MKIKYSNLTISTPENPPKNFSLTLKKTLQTDKAIGLENAMVSDRGNCVSSVSFSVENSRKTPELAEEFCIDFIREISKLPPSTLEIIFGEGENRKSFKIENAAVSKCRASVEGRITSHSLEFTAGAAEE